MKLEDIQPGIRVVAVSDTFKETEHWVVGKRGIVESIYTDGKKWPILVKLDIGPYCAFDPIELRKEEEFDAVTR